MSDFHRAAPRLSPHQPDPLSSRELQILRLVADGLTADEIGGQLYLSRETVRSHLMKLRRKLDAKDRAHAVAKAFRSGVLQ